MERVNSALRPILKPDDPYRVKQLEQKLKQYEDRYSSYTAPELQQDTMCKKLTLETVLREGYVDPVEVLATIKYICGQAFNLDECRQATEVIRDYVETGGANCNHGTGLPKV